MFLPLLDLLDTIPLTWLGVILFGAMLIAVMVGHYMHERQPQARKNLKDDGNEGYVVTAVLGLLALLTGFTFSLATDRFEARRELVLQHANAIGTAYLRAQLLPEPHRARLSGLFVQYTDNIIALAKAPPRQGAALLARDDVLLTQLWAATAAGFDSTRTLPASGQIIASVNEVIDMDGARRAARWARVPLEVFGVLFIYLIGTAGVLGYVLTAKRGRLVAGFVLVLLTLSQLLILDIDRPNSGSIRESQRPMEVLRESLKQQPPAAFDRWRTLAPAP
jgi:hypothetical protein